jgi:uncharacterized protein (TIGR04222 family)
MILAEIPVFDLNGPAFLALYAVMFVVAAIGSFSRGRAGLNRFDRAGYYPELTDSYDTAYLAAGAPRVAQLAVVRLMQSGHVGWKSGITGKRLAFLNPTGGSALNAIERTMLNAVRQKGNKGLPVAEAYTAVLPEMRALEVKLASLGLRPTEGERKKAGWSAALPLLALLAVGFIKLMVGIFRDKPVGFLILLMLFTMIIAVVVGSSTRRLTKTGEELLAKLRMEKDRPRGDSAFENVCWNLALTGPAVLADIPAFSGIYQDLAKQMGRAPSGSQGGGCGSSSSGCGSGSSGCGSGGGGCGGCGGGD